jgi:hypothetical protein
MAGTTAHMQWSPQMRSLNTLLSVEEVNPLVTHLSLYGSFKENLHVSKQ